PPRRRVPGATRSTGPGPGARRSRRGGCRTPSRSAPASPRRRSYGPRLLPRKIPTSSIGFVDIVEIDSPFDQADNFVTCVADSSADPRRSSGVLVRSSSSGTLAAAHVTVVHGIRPVLTDVSLVL